MNPTRIRLSSGWQGLPPITGRDVLRLARTQLRLLLTPQNPPHRVLRMRWRDRAAGEWIALRGLLRCWWARSHDLEYYGRGPVCRRCAEGVA